MHKDSYGFVNAAGRFLRLCLNDEPFDGQESHESAWFTMDVYSPIWETDDAAVILDLLNPWGSLPFLSEDARGGCLPSRHAGGSLSIDLREMTPVCFRRQMGAVIHGGDEIATATEVFVVSFADQRDPNSSVLSAIESSPRLGPEARDMPPESFLTGSTDIY
jgi:hypothetical protein